MKYTIENGKWRPKDGSFVRVENNEIPDLIQLLQENSCEAIDHYPDVTSGFLLFHREVWYNNGGTLSMTEREEVPLADFKALVTMKLPGSWCTQCTEKAMAHPAWHRFLESIGGYVGDCIGEYYSPMFKSPETLGREVISIDCWAAVEGADKLSELDEVLKDPSVQNDPEHKRRLSITPVGKPTIIPTLLPGIGKTNLYNGRLMPQEEERINEYLSQIKESEVDKFITSELTTDDLIAELKSRGYGVISSAEQERRDFAKAALSSIAVSCIGDDRVSENVRFIVQYAEALQDELDRTRN